MEVKAAPVEEDKAAPPAVGKVALAPVTQARAMEGTITITAVGTAGQVATAATAATEGTMAGAAGGTMATMAEGTKAPIPNDSSAWT